MHYKIHKLAELVLYVLLITGHCVYEYSKFVDLGRATYVHKASLSCVA